MALSGQHFEVDPPLSDIIKHFYYIRTTADHTATTAHLSPNFEMMLLFNFGAPVRISFAGDPLGPLQVNRLGILGPLRRMLNYDLLPDADILAAVFNLDGFYRLFNIPMDDMNSEKIYHPDEMLLNTCGEDLWAVLKHTDTAEMRVQLLGEYILSVTSAPEPASLPLLNGASYFKDPLIQPVKAIAADAALTPRTIQVRFKKYTGYSPKELLRFLRFKQVISSITAHPGSSIDWFDLIHDHGYHDQSHLIKDFNHFLGLSPQAFIKQFAGKEFCTTKEGKNYT